MDHLHLNGGRCLWQIVHAKIFYVYKQGMFKGKICSEYVYIYIYDYIIERFPEQHSDSRSHIWETWGPQTSVWQRLGKLGQVTVRNLAPLVAIPNLEMRHDRPDTWTIWNSFFFGTADLPCPLSMPLFTLGPTRCPHLMGKKYFEIGVPHVQIQWANQYLHHPNCWQFDSWGRIWQRHKDSYHPWVRLQIIV